MAIDFKRGFYSNIRNKLPRNLRTVEDFYFLSFSASAVFCLMLLSPLLIYAGQWRAGWSSGLCALLITACLALWRAGIPIPWVQIGYQATLMWVILFNAYYSGGVASPVMVWMGIVPILPLFTVSRRWSYAWLIITFISVIVIYWAQLHGLVPLSEGRTQEELALSTIMIGALCITQVILVMTYDSANAQNIRHIKRKNATLNTLSQDLHLANVYKDKFLATVSHEMRTPLNAIMGYLGLLRTTDELPTIATSYVQGAQNSAAHLLTVINDLLDYSQIRQGKLVFTPQTVNLHQVLKETHQTLAPKAAGQDLDYVLDIDTNLPQWARIDPHRFAQILLNLLGNALKFTEQGGSVTTRVRFELAPLEPEAGQLILQVQDTGIGIPGDSIEHVFEPFVQLDTQSKLGNDNALRGNGLGLSITKNLIKNLGGTITLTSQVGVGSTFEVKLPIKTAQAPLASIQAPVNQTHQDEIYLLLVDDHATNRLVAAATIKRGLPKARIDEARNGTEAIEKMKANHYDLVLMDLIMPDYSGIEVTRIIRAECPPPLCDVEVVALTANMADDAVKACLQVGIRELLPKPFDREVLIRTIRQHVPRLLSAHN
jgi:signal transduction histidine kinase/ActR/RegA family two-component response regulator